MKILALTNIIPYPLNEGGKTAQFFFLESLVKEHEVILVMEISNDEEINNVKAIKERLPALKIYCIDKNNKEDRKKLKIRIIEKFIWELNKLLPKESEDKNIIKNSFFTNPVIARSPEVIEQYRTIIENENADIVQIDFIDNADLAMLVPPGKKKIMILHDIRFSTLRQAAEIKNYDHHYVEYITALVKTVELSYLKLFDGVITFSNNDAEKLNKHLSNVFVSPFSTGKDLLIETPDRFKFEKLIFIGPDHHYPNVDALQWYAENLSAIVHEKFGLQLTVIGKWSEKNRKKFEKFPAIKFAGYVEDLKSFLRSSVMIVPLRMGSGIRTKIIEAFANETPVISTTLGAEGIGATDGEHILIADDESKFISAISCLKSDTEVVDHIRIMAKRLFTERFSQEAVYKKRIGIYNEMLHKNKAMKAVDV